MIRFYTKLTLHQPPPPHRTTNHPPTQTQYLRFYSSDVDQNLKVGSWDQSEQIPTVIVTFVQARFVLVTFVYIKHILAVTDPILTKI